MRGKYILSLALIVAMFGAFFVDLGHTQTPITVYADPAMVTGVYGGQTFDVNIMITGGEAVYAWEFLLDYPPFAQQISVVDAIAGDYLGPDQILAKNVNAFDGEVLVGSTMQGDVEGAYGDGTLATVRFTVIEPAGEFPLDLVYARIFIRVGYEIVEMAPEDITVVDSYFLGPIADLDHNPGETRTDNVWRVGKSRRFKTIVENKDPIEALWFRAKYTSVQDTGRVVTMYNGQHLYTSVPRATEYYYVNEFTATRIRWAQIGTSPYLDKADGTSYVSGDTYCTTVGMFGFQDITLNPGDIIYRVTLEGRTRAAHGDIDYDVYDAAFNWYGSLWGGGAWSWKTPRWTTDTIDIVNPAVKTQAGFNSFQVLLHYYTPAGNTLGPADLDALRLKVEYIGIDPINPKAVQIPPATIKTLDWAIWDLWPFDVGTYTTTITVEYRWGTPDPRFPQYWATAPTVNTFTWTAHP